MPEAKSKPKCGCFLQNKFEEDYKKTIWNTHETPSDTKRSYYE